MRAGDKVELRSPDEILASLDEHGALEGLPFMRLRGLEAVAPERYAEAFTCRKLSLAVG